MHFEVVSDREVAVDGIGVLKPNEPVTLDENQLAHFQALHGYSLTEAKFPNFVSVNSILDNDDENDENDDTEVVDVVVEEKEEE